MSEEEKEAIDNLKLNIMNNGFSLYGGTTNIFNLKDIEIALNLIFKLQKENYELNSDLKVFKRALTDIEKENEELKKQLDQLKEVDRQICNEELITKDKYKEILKENAELKDSREVLSKEILSDKARIVLFKEKIEELQKENEELKTELSKIQCDNRQMEEDSISKDIIRNRIKELKNTYSEHSEFRIGKTIEVLEELLGE